MSNEVEGHNGAKNQAEKTNAGDINVNKENRDSTEDASPDQQEQIDGDQVALDTFVKVCMPFSDLEGDTSCTTTQVCLERTLCNDM